MWQKIKKIQWASPEVHGHNTRTYGQLLNFLSKLIINQDNLL